MEILSYIITLGLGLIVLSIPILALKYVLHATDKPIGDHFKEALKISETLPDEKI